MSLFDDDFYSTKVSARNRRNGRGGRRREYSGKWAVAVVSALAGAMVMFGMLQIGPQDDSRAASVPTSGPVHTTDDPVVLAAESIIPTVVSIISFSGEEEPGQRGERGIGSGVIFEKQGGKARIVTNHHVVESGSRLEVILASGERKAATVIGKDLISDLAVLEVDAKGVERVAEFGDSDRLRPGERAIAVGNPLGLGFSQSITAGVISWPSRKIPVSFGGDGSYDWEYDVIQTDAAINQGNSGGALVNSHGQVIGINSMKIAHTGVEGLGFALPINQVKETVDSLIRYGQVKRPFMGVTAIELDVDMRGVSELELPRRVKNGLIVLEAADPAKAAGLKANDVIVELDDQPVATMLDLRKYLYSKKRIGDELNVTFYRQGDKQTLTLTLAESQKE